MQLSEETINQIYAIACSQAKRAWRAEHRRLSGGTAEDYAHSALIAALEYAKRVELPADQVMPHMVRTIQTQIWKKLPHRERLRKRVEAQFCALRDQGISAGFDLDWALRGLAPLERFAVEAWLAGETLERIGESLHQCTASVHRSVQRAVKKIAERLKKDGKKEAA